MLGFLLVALLLLAGSVTAPAAPVVLVEQGVFFEAEDYDGRPWYGDESFGTRLQEPLASGGAVLIGMYQPGAVTYRLAIPAAGEYHVWLRCAVPGDTTVRIGANATSEADLLTAPVAATTAGALTASGAYQWRKLGTLALREGENSLILGQGAQRPDCFFLTPDAGFQPGEDFLDRVLRAKQTPRGQLLPELTHERRITRHPQWLRQAWRASYAHLEWDRDKTAPEEWCRRAREAGAMAIVGAGEVPAGSVDGALKVFPIRMLDDGSFRLPENYSLDYQWTRTFVEAAHRQGLKMVLYDGAYRTLDPLLLDHPEWRQRHADGRVWASGFGAWHSPYRRAYVDRWVQIAKISGMDGIMIDMLFTAPPGGDFSDSTVQAFRDRFGVEPPRDPDPRNLTWQRWIDFQAWTREEVLLDLTEALHAVNPEIAVIANQVGGWIFNHTDRSFLKARAARCCDGFLEEMGWEFQATPERPWAGGRPWAWPLHAQWQSLFLHCRTRPGWGQMWCISHNFPTPHNESLNYAMFANGVAPGVTTGGNWDAMSRVWGHIEACESAMEGASLEPWLALHFGEDTLDWYANTCGFDRTRDDPRYEAYMKNVFGLFQAALELHLPVEILTDEELADLDGLRRYAAVLLPNSACLSEAQGRVLGNYVQGGGGLVATAESGCFDENGTRLETPRLAALLGAIQHEPRVSTNWYLPLRELSHPLVDHPEIRDSGAWEQGQYRPRDRGVLYSGRRSIAAAPVSDVAAEAFSLPLTGGPPTTGDYRLLARKHGQGRVAFISLDIGHAYYVWNHPLNRRLIGQALTWAASRPVPLRTNGPMILQTVLWRRDESKVLHLLNDISSFGRAAAPNPEAYTPFRAEVIPLHDVGVSVAGDLARARLLPQGQDLPVSRADGWSTVTVPRVDVHAIVVFSP